MGLCAVSDLK
jgi:hypothetical protein